ncbi:Ig-like domain-containing protein [Chloroflexi bacterium TSY]|nr:Ig-like domain-containing protein [Chloroflexi bacterium TSY]
MNRSYPVSIVLIALWLSTAWALLPVQAQEFEQSRTEGPGLPQRNYSEEELFRIMGRINGSNGAPRSHGTVSMHQGYLVVIFAEGSGKHDGGFAFYDLSDPSNPRLVASKDDEETHDIREAHGYGYHGNYVALQAKDGLQIWDWTDIQNPIRLSYLELPGIGPGDYANANWWTFWQAPYIYVSGANQGIFIVDATDPTDPVLVNRRTLPNPIPIFQTGGFRIGALFAVGDLLVVSGNDAHGYATLDISDPITPILLDTLTVDVPQVYSTLVNGNLIYSAARFGEIESHHIGPNGEITAGTRINKTGGKGGYLSYQDGFIHMGASKNYAKVDVSDPDNFRVVQKATSNIQDRDEDFAMVLGNLVILGDDHHNGSFILPHQSEPDMLGPIVNMVRPVQDAFRQALTTPIGLTFSDLIDLRTVTTETFIVRPIGGEAIQGLYSGQTGIVNFVPAEPLLPDTTYEIVVPSDGIKDIAGNGLRESFQSQFSTGVSGVVQN